MVAVIGLYDSIKYALTLFTNTIIQQVSFWQPADSKTRVVKYSEQDSGKADAARSYIVVQQCFQSEF